jgi:predicted nucleic acid-binding protein
MFEGFHGGFFALLPLNADDLPAIATLMKRYESVGLQLADAALAHLAEREDLRTVFTTDRRDFSIIRLKRNRTLRLIPNIP